ncbi:MAG: helix-turn-helix transcriptional regulator [SAR202 cluster bacterium]|jgi:DNA-binding NarL/FixJ family response regulator|nr:helix-turn-helix transcriptional regulator [SAR202 cluster bacterium]MDP6511790.1 helix-turn-helix transcriptional regulator [SAR202 cluster bacterium]MDP6716201.1 helix-turn-helix transcriptional regulator [SAR202 cluster bacterium]
MLDSDRIRKVTSTERRVAALVACGYTNREIAEALGNSPHTIRRHVSNLMMKLDLTRRAQIAVLADRRGWTDQ